MLDIDVGLGTSADPTDFSLWADEEWVGQDKQPEPAASPDSLDNTGDAQFKKEIAEMKRERGLSSNSELAKELLSELSAPQEGEVLPAVEQPPRAVHIGESTAKLSRDSIVSDLSDALSRHAKVITFLNESGRPLIYAKRSHSGEVLPFYKLLPRKEAEAMAHHFIKDRGDLHHLAVPAVSRTTNAVIDTMEQATLVPGETRSNGLVCLGIDPYGSPIYYDTTRSELQFGEAETDRPCFAHLCDTPYPISGVPKIDFEKIDTKVVEQYAAQAENDLKNHLKYGQPYPVRFQSTFGLWSDGDDSLYLDLLTISALPLFATKPPKIFFPLGVAANGKSGWRHLLMTIYGTENTASVSTKQMGDWSYTSTLDGKLLNFPDEDDVQAALDTPFFKSIASHDTVNFAKKGSSEPLRIKCDFVSIIPMNREPEWSNMDGGIMRRVCILPFTHDFSSEDSNVSSSFEESTFTPELISQLIGEFVGIARYYAKSGSELIFSDRTNRSNQEFIEVHDNVKLFKSELERFYYAYSSSTFLYDCYVRWCHNKDVPPVDKGRFKLYFKDYTAVGKIRLGGKPTRICKRPNAPSGLFVVSQYAEVPYAQSSVPGGKPLTKSLQDLYNMGIDPITALENLRNERMEWVKN